MSSSTFIKKPKPTSQMTTAELRAQAEADGLRYYEQQLAADPENPQAKYELESYCAARGIRMNPEVNRLYDMSKEKLAQEWEAKGKAADAAELEKYREGQAKIWMASQTRYVPTPEAARKIIDTLNASGLRGSVADLQQVFDTLLQRGEIDAPAEPVPVYSREELSQMSAADCKRALEEMGFGTV